jgi:EamA domain-containing membrane protein RarD
MGTIWQLLVTFISAFVGLIVFSEKLSTWQWTGVVVAMIATILLMIEK